jgi:HK97 family phage prohead protease
MAMSREGVEFRIVTRADSGVADAGVADQGFINGVAALFDEWAQIGPKSWGFRERIMPGAFTKTLSEADQVFLLNHNSDYPISRKSAGSLEMRETDRGLEFRSAVPDTSYGRDLAENIRNGNIRGMSFGFTVPEGKDDWGTADDGTEERTIREVRLFEISAVTFPAYDATEVALRDAITAAREHRKAIASHSTATSDASWDGPANKAHLSNDAGAMTLRTAYAWADPNGNPETKADYKFIHHFVDDSGNVGAASTVACSSGIAVLNGGRTGTTIPSDDRQGVYAHLARHLRDANMEPPELKSAEDLDTPEDAPEDSPRQTILTREAIDRLAEMTARVRGLS